MDLSESDTISDWFGDLAAIANEWDYGDQCNREWKQDISEFHCEVLLL